MYLALRPLFQFNTTQRGRSARYISCLVYVYCGTPIKAYDDIKEAKRGWSDLQKRIKW